VTSAQLKEEKGEVGKQRNPKMQLTNSIEMIEKRVPSMEKQQFSNRMKTEGSGKGEKEVRENSLSKILRAGKNFLGRISRSSTEVLKKKEEPLERKNHMKDFLK
jgi:hypothetical protein